MSDNIDIAMPAKAVIRRDIIAGVLKRHRLCSEEFFSRSTMGELVAARREAAALLLQAGFTPGHVAKILKRERTTIAHYFSEAASERKRSRSRVYKILYSLPPDVRSIIEGVAKADQASPHVIIREWISERAQHEAAARARAA